MEKILFIAFQFPPKGGPGVQRSVQFVKYLREFGYDPIVLTITEKDVNMLRELKDPSLLQEFSTEIKILRTPSGIPFRFINSLQKLRMYRMAWFFLYPFFWERAARWPWKVKNEAVKIIKENNIKLIYTTSGPFASLILGDYLKKKLKIKWIADLRDPYTDAYVWQFPSIIHWKWERRFEKKYFSRPDFLIVNTEEVRKLYIKRRLMPEDRIKVITNGF